jgi:hypothetical protein
MGSSSSKDQNTGPEQQPPFANKPIDVEVAPSYTNDDVVPASDQAAALKYYRALQ